jgi:hypothetical protein
MNSIEQIFLEAVLADIVYVDGLESSMTGSTLAGKIKYRIPEPMATVIGERFKVAAVKSEPASDY